MPHAFTIPFSGDAESVIGKTLPGAMAKSYDEQEALTHALGAFAIQEFLADSPAFAGKH